MSIYRSWLEFSDTSGVCLQNEEEEKFGRRMLTTKCGRNTCGSSVMG